MKSLVVPFVLDKGYELLITAFKGALEVSLRFVDLSTSVRAFLAFKHFTTYLTRMVLNSLLSILVSFLVAV